MTDGSVLAYIESLYPAENRLRRQIIDGCPLEHFGHIVAGDTARVLSLLVSLIRPQTVLELGTSIGYSALAIARALPAGGRLITIDHDPRPVACATRLWVEHGLADRIECQIIDARQYLPTCNRQFDMIFQDIGHKPLYAGLFGHCLRLLRAGGLLVAEDTLFPLKKGLDSPSGQAIHQFNRLVAESPGLASVLLPVDDGLTLAVKQW
ncbi:MAG: class I SAM-dependent methyltransferase [Negativicutes bacterium]|nr:class I SAM-dependent methyltransferase [Negativicutes bacterium]